MSPAVTSVEAPADAVEAIRLRRAERYAAREYLWTRSKLQRGGSPKGEPVYSVRQCGRYMLSSAVAVRVSTGADGRRTAGYSNLEHCGSVWACPVCSARINHVRSATLAEALHRHDANGGKVCMVTLTVRHDASQSLAKVWDSVGKAWTAAIGGGTWARAEEQFAMYTRQTGKRAGEPWVPFWRVFEVTHGVNGWHVHVHALMLVHGSFTDTDAASMGAILWRRWDAAAQRAGMAAGDIGVGLDAQVVTGDPSHALGDYFAKAVYELTGSRFKTGAVRGNHRTPWGILADLVSRTGTARQYRRNLALWYEWEQASKGRRAMGRSRGLLALLGMDEWEPSDQEIVDEELNGVDVFLIGPDEWRLMCRRGMLAGVLSAFERSVSDGVRFLEGIALVTAGASPPEGDRGGGLVARVPSGPVSADHVRQLYGVTWQPGLTD